MDGLPTNTGYNPDQETTLFGEGEIPNQIGDNPYYRVSDHQLSRLIKQPEPKKYYMNQNGKAVEHRQATAVGSENNTSLGVSAGQVAGNGTIPAGATVEKPSGSSTYSDATKMAVAEQISDLQKAGSDYATAHSKANEKAGDKLYVKEQKGWEPSLVGVRSPSIGSGRNSFSA